MPDQTQSYKNHARFQPPFHFFLTPVLLLHLVWTVLQFQRVPSLERAESILLAVALIVLAGLARMNALKVQDRLIRLEEQLRYDRVLTPDLSTQAASLPVSQIVALRFASDAELPQILGRILSGELTSPQAIKQAVQNWRGDYVRV